MLLDLALNGLIQGSLLSLICVGYSLAYGSARVINFAHADVMIAGGGYLVLLWIEPGPEPVLRLTVMSALFGAAGWIACPLLLPMSAGPSKSLSLIPLVVGGMVAALTWLLAGQLAFVAALLLAAPWTALLAAAIYRLGYLPLLQRHAPRTSVLLAALGFSIALESILLIAWGTTRRVLPANTLPTPLVVTPLEPGITAWNAIMRHGMIPITPALSAPVHDAVILAGFLLVTGTLVAFFRYSRTADAIVATADSQLGARACGISVERVVGHAFLIGGAVASVAGTLYVLRSKSLDPAAGFAPGILAFAACVMGGIGSIRGSIAGAFLISFIMAVAPAIPVESWATAMLPSSWLPFLPSLNLSDWSYGVVYLSMILIILFKPEGLFAR